MITFNYKNGFPSSFTIKAQTQSGVCPPIVIPGQKDSPVEYSESPWLITEAYFGTGAGSRPLFKATLSFSVEGHLTNVMMECDPSYKTTIHETGLWAVEAVMPSNTTA